MSNSESNICPQCGKIQEEESIFCGSCGADLSNKTAERSIDKRTLTHRPLENEEFSRKSRTSKHIGRFTPGSENSGEFDNSTFAESSYTPSRENANKASILAIFSFFVNLLFIPTVLFVPYLRASTIGIIMLAILGIIFNLFFVPTFLGLEFVKEAELENEDISMVILAKILLGAQFIGWLVIYIGGLVLTVWVLTI